MNRESLDLQLCPGSLQDGDYDSIGYQSARSQNRYYTSVKFEQLMLILKYSFKKDKYCMRNHHSIHSKPVPLILL